ncbi:uncharacterized protein LOC141619811 [Silene latifolia]|uniref:uncharacterized protein LOC141619811 n=1 Tax=Silene latifolia TaxID=37657 RepID=UPI003D77FF03
MGGATRGKKTKISQEAFDELVRENVEELGLDRSEAVEDAIETLTLQGVDLSGIITSDSDTPHPVLETLNKLKEDDLSVTLLHHFSLLCAAPDDAAIASRNGAVETLTSISSKLSTSSDPKLVISALSALSSLLRDVQSNETFARCGGPDIIVAIILSKQQQQQDSVDLLNACFSVIAASATGSEILKESFVNLNVDQLIINAFNHIQPPTIPAALYDAIRVLLTSDDHRVAASQVFGYARRFAKLGIADALANSLRQGLTSSSLVSASVALKAVVVNDDICRSVADKGGIDAVLQCIDDSGEEYNTAVARSCCSLLCKLAGSDHNKSAIVEKRGIDRLIRLSARFADDPSVIQEVMYIISVLCLRSPNHATRAMEAGAGDLAIQVMQTFPASQQLQKNACLMIRNLVVRNPENRKNLLDNGVEQIIRKARKSHGNCKDAATDALRDLGLANYNL